MVDSPDERSPLAVGMEWTSRLTTIALEMSLPGLLGWWVDQKLGTKLVFLVLGVIVGFSSGTWQLIRLAKPPQKSEKPPRRSSAP